MDPVTPQPISSQTEPNTSAASTSIPAPVSVPPSAREARPPVRVEPGARAFDLAGSSRGTGGRTARSILRRSVPWLVGLIIACAWDRATFLHIAVKDAPTLAKLESADWYRTLRIIGAPYIWLFVSVIFILVDAQRASRIQIPGDNHSGYFTGKTPSLRRATFLILSALLSGAAAEIVKAIVGRYKPDTADGWYRFASFHERFVDFRWNDLGFVSSHAATAFGACFALSIMLPRASVVFMVMAIGCAMTRLLAGAHFLSDTYGAVLLAFVVSQGVYRLDRRNNQGRGIDFAQE